MRIKKGTPFPLLNAVSLLSHKSRLHKFHLAIQEKINSTKRVLDIGTGSGVLAMLAAKAGAKHVDAIEIVEESAEYAAHVVKQHGLENIVDIHCCHFEDFTPREKYDVVICEMLSSFMLIEQQIPAMNHARSNFLKEKGDLLPTSIQVFGVLVEANKTNERFHFADISFPPIPQTALDEDMTDLSSIFEVASFDFRSATIESQRISRTYEIEIVRKGTIHGLAGMFEARVSKEIAITMEDGWKPLLIPLQTTLEVEKGKSVIVNLSFIPGNLQSLKLEISLT